MTISVSLNKNEKLFDLFIRLAFQKGNAFLYTASRDRFIKLWHVDYTNKKVLLVNNIFIDFFKSES